MSAPCNDHEDWDTLERKIIGLGERSHQKSYYPALQRQLHEQQRVNRALQMLSAVNQLLLHASEEQDLLEGVCQLLAELGGYPLVWVGYAEHGQQQNIRIAAAAGPKQAYLEHVDLTWSDTPSGTGVMGMVIRTGDIVTIEDFSTDPRVANWRDVAARNQFHSAISFPLRNNGAVYGGITLYAAEINAFSPEEIRLLTELVNDLAYGINTLRTRQALREREESLRQSEAKYATIFQASPDAVTLTLLPDARILEINPGFTELTGFTAEDVVGRTFFEIPIWVTDEERDHMYSYAIKHQEFNNYEFRTRRKDGSIRYTSTSARATRIDGDLCILGFTRDITERKRAEEAVRQSEQKYATIFQTSPDAITLARLPDMALLDVNHGFTKLTGYTAEEVRGRTFSELSLWITDETPNHFYARIIKQKDVDNYEFRFIRKDGNLRYGSTSARTMQVGNEAYLLSVTQDITERRQMEEAIREILNTESGLVGALFFKRMVEVLSRFVKADIILIGELQPDGNTMEALAVTQDGVLTENITYMLNGTPCQDVIRQNVCIYPDNVAALFPQDVLLQDLHIRGYIGVPLFNTHHEVIGVMVCLYRHPIADTSFAQTILQLFAPRTAAEIERLHAEAALRASEERYRVLTETSTVGIWQVDLQGHTLYANPAMRAILEIDDLHEITQKRQLDFFTPESADRLRQEYARHTHGVVSRYESVLIGMRGTRRDVLVISAPIPAADGMVESIIGTVTDITALKEAARAKDQFLMVLSHELKTPLTSILGWTQAAKAMPTIIPQALETIERNAFDQKRLLEDLLDVSRIVTGRLTITRQQVDLWPLVQESIQVMAPFADERHITMQIHAPAEPLPLLADPGRIKQVVRNLLDNAIKYTATSGTVAISVSREGTWAVLEVQDTGRGIAAEDIPKLFTPFQQIARTEEVGGLGLGLVLIRGIIQAHGGHVTVDSPGVGKGSTFRVWLPLRVNYTVE